MDTIVTALAEQHASLESTLAGLDRDGWDRPSWCEGWTVADVVLHLAQTDELALASVTGRYDEAVERLARDVTPTATADDAAAGMVERERGEPGPAVLERWRSGAAAVRDALAAADPSARVPWVAGQLSARTLAATRLAECWIHAGDVRWAFGQPPEAADRLRHVARLAWRTVPYAFARAGRPAPGPVAFELTGPDGSAWTFRPDGEAAATVVRGDGTELCLVAGQRRSAADTSLRAEGPDADAVLELVRTFA